MNEKIINPGPPKNKKRQKLSLEDQKKLNNIGIAQYLLHDNPNFQQLEKKVNEAIAKAREEQNNATFLSSNEMVCRLEEHYLQDIEEVPTSNEIGLFEKFLKDRDIQGSEYWFCPEEQYYEAVIQQISENDIVYDIGSGDLRFDILLASKVKKVYAIEINPILVGKALGVIGLSLPKNLNVIVGNGFEYPIPNEVTVITMLMIHCQHEFTEEMLKRKIIYAKRGGLCVYSPRK